jgi:protein ImuB
VVIATQASVVRIVGADARATRVGVHTGMTLAEARALLPELVTQPHHPHADRTALESLAVWVDRFSPCVHLEGDDTLLLDMTGTQRLFPDEEALLPRVADGVRQLGYTVRAAIADTPGAAWALAHAHPANLIAAPPGRTFASLAPLPVDALRINQETLSPLKSLGVRTIESLLHLPRSSLASRFGDQLLYRLDQALGTQTELLKPFRPHPVLKSSLHIGRPSDRRDILCQALDRLLTSFCEQLERRVAGVRQLFLTFHCPDLRPITFELNVSRATRSARHLRSLFNARIDRLQLPTGAAGLVLWARRVEPLDAWQDELFDTGRADVEGLAQLIDRLANQLGHQAVVRPQPASDHQPEHAYAYNSIADCGLQIGDFPAHTAPSQTATRRDPASSSHFSLLTSHFSPRPLRILPRPVEVPVIATVPDGPPACFNWKNSKELIMHCVGPERLETGWWRGRHVRRDYYRATCESGRQCWLFRQLDKGTWFLHGWFD